MGSPALRLPVLAFVASVAGACFINSIRGEFVIDDFSATVSDPDVTVDGFLDLYAAFLSHMGQTPTLDGFIVQASRSRGCSIESMVRSGLGHATAFNKPFGRPLRMWFSVGVGECACSP